MIEIRLEIEPKNKTPLEVENLLVKALDDLVKNQDIEHYSISTPSFEGDFEATWETIHTGGKEVSP
jgi:hypothetical protein